MLISSTIYHVIIHSVTTPSRGVRVLFCLRTENPRHIFVFASAHRQTGSKLPCDSTPCFPGSRWRSSPSTRCSLTSRPWAVRWPRRRFLLLVGSYFSPTEPFLVFYALDSFWSRKVGAVVLSRSQTFLSMQCVSVAMDWFQGFFSDLCLDQVEKTVSLTCGSLSSYMFHPVSFKSTWLQMFLHILGLWTPPPLCIFWRWPGILRISFFLEASPGFLKPAKIYLWKVMAERGALSLLSLLCLTFLSAETTVAKHVDKGKCLTHCELLCSMSASLHLDWRNLPSTNWK